MMNRDTGIRKDAILKLHIVDATGMTEYDSHFVQAQQDIAKEQTGELPGVGPIWNEAIVFDIRDIHKPLIVTLVNSRNKQVLRGTIDLQSEEIMDYSKMGQDIWIPEEDENDY